MEWWQLVIALIVITAYVVKHIVGAQQEQQQARERLRDQAPKPVVATQSDEDVARDRTALDRRIEEAIERRRDMDERPASSPLPKRAIPMPAPPVVLYPPVPRYQPSASPVIATPPVKRPTPVKPAIPVVAPAPATHTATPTEAPAVVRALASTKHVSPTLKQVLDLLKSRQSIATAVVLREILDRPMSQRRRRV
jgi:hypothetical protein